jgi:Zn-dependent protease
VEWVIQLPVLLFSVIVHECSHGWVAFIHGDDTAERSGRLTLNPVPHLDAFGTFFVPAICFLLQAPMFGWAKPVPVDGSRLRNPRRDMMRVALAGPIANIFLACIAVVALKLATLVPLSAQFAQTLRDVLLFGAMVNLFLAFFNLIPVFPLDGSRVLEGLLPAGLSRLYQRHSPYGSFIILGLLLTQKLGMFIMWPMNAVLKIWSRMGLLG